jgi:hypothetical protein
MLTMDEGVAIFIDGRSISGCLQNGFDRFDIDYERLATCLTEAASPAAQLLRVYYYGAPLRRPSGPAWCAKQRRLLYSLGGLPHFRVALGRPEVPLNGRVETGLAIRLATDLLKCAGIYDTAVLVTGNGDVTYAVGAARALGRQVIYGIGPGSQSRRLRQACDRTIPLTQELFESCARKGYG